MDTYAEEKKHVRTKIENVSACFAKISQNLEPSMGTTSNPQSDFFTKLDFSFAKMEFHQLQITQMHHQHQPFTAQLVQAKKPFIVVSLNQKKTDTLLVGGFKASW